MKNKTEEINCMWLNKTFGDNYWVCNGLLKAVTPEICKKCKERREKKK